VNGDPPDLDRLDRPDLDRLDRLGRVDPPAPGVLDAAREVLWSAVAAEMLATAPHEQRRIAEPGAEEAAGQPRWEDPSAP
jgi:hypothetical protein